MSFGILKTWKENYLNMRIVKRGAEAVIWMANGHIVKERVKKSYRLPQIDEKLRKLRTRKEASLLLHAKRAGVSVPEVISVLEPEFKVKMEYVDGKRLKEFLNETDDKGRKKAATMVGKAVGLLHSSGIIHGDLTTSNMILREGKVYLIDFGLGDHSKRIESQAIDLSVLREAFKSTHYKYLSILWESFIKGYGQTNDNFNKVLDALNGIEKRGRYVER
jgi:TP53 regulating kinase and related kinases